ncbi:hypothetical protein SNEBB_001085 [Seison nebaliae]|nr:hypothetical protein SNEBB_001085 [Seison nebaliae]
MSEFQHYLDAMKRQCPSIPFVAQQNRTIPSGIEITTYYMRMFAFADKMVVNDTLKDAPLRKPYCRPPRLTNEMGTCYSISMSNILLSTYSLLNVLLKLDNNSSQLKSSKFRKRYEFYKNMTLYSNDTGSKMRASLQHARIFYQHMMLVYMGLRNGTTSLVGHQKFYGCQLMECGNSFKKTIFRNLAHLPEDAITSNLLLDKLLEKNIFSVHRHIPILHFCQFLFQKEKFSHQWEVMYPGGKSSVKKNFRLYESFDVDELYYYSEQFSMLIVNYNPYDGKYGITMPDLQNFLPFVAPLYIWHSHFQNNLPNILILNYVTSNSPIYFDYGSYIDFEKALLDTMVYNKTINQAIKFSHESAKFTFCN